MVKFATAWAAVLAVAAAVSAQTTHPAAREWVRAGKAATALLELPNGTATAFCISPAGLFVTNHHVVQAAGASGKIKLILNSGEVNEKQVVATVLRSDAASDLGLLQAASGGPFTALPLGNVEELIETMEVTAFGYPFGTKLSSAGSTYPNISVSTGRITSLRKTGGKVSRIQLDASLNPGCSGGPILDAGGRVIGVVEKGILGGGGAVNFAVPVSLLIPLLRQPDLSFTAPALSGQDKGKALPVSVRVASLPPFTPTLTIELTLHAGPDRRSFPLKADGEAFTAQVVFLPPDKGPVEVSLQARFERGMVEGFVQDGTVSVAGKCVPLKDIARIEPGISRAFFRDGRSDGGPVAGLETLAVLVGDQKPALDLRKARSIKITAPPEIAYVDYTITAREGQAVVRELSGRIPVQTEGAMAPGLPAPGPVAAADPAAKPPDVVERKLPGEVTDAVMGGSGRYLAMWLAGTGKVVIFDVPAARIVKELPVDSRDVQMAAGAEHLVLALPDKNLLVRYRLDGQFANDLAVPIPGARKVHSMAMGAGSRGPILLSLAGTTASTRAGDLILVDVNTLKPSSTVSLDSFPGQNDNLVVRTSYDGLTFGLSRSGGSSSSGVYSFSIRDNKAGEVYHQFASAGVAIPSPDGRFLATSRGICKIDLTDLSRSYPSSGSGSWIPSVQGELYLFVKSGTRTIYSKGSKRTQRAPLVSVNLPADGNALLTLVPTPSISTTAVVSSTRIKYTADKRYFLLPASGTVVALPEGCESLFLLPVNLPAAVKAHNYQGMFLLSSPTPTAVRGAPYAYTVAPLSLKGGYRYSLEAAPKGMTVSADGRVNWTVPRDLQADSVPVSIRIQDAGGVQMLHAFTLRLRSPEN